MPGRVFECQAGVEFTYIFALINDSFALVSGQAGAVVKELRDQDGAATEVVTVEEQGTSGFYEARFTPTKHAPTGHTYLLRLKAPPATTDGAIYHVELRSFPSLLLAPEAVGAFFTTLAAVKEYADITGSTQDAIITNLIARVTRVMQDRMGRRVLEGTWTEIHDGIARPGIIVRERPITSVTSIHESPDQTWDSSTLIAASDYIVDGRLGRIKLKADVFLPGFQNVRVIYLGGYATVPAALEHVAIRMVSRELKTRKNLDVQSMTLKDGSFSNAVIQNVTRGITNDDIEDMAPWVARRVA